MAGAASEPPLHTLPQRRAPTADLGIYLVQLSHGSPHLIESEIFGHEQGSFAGAEHQHQGFFERAHGGTLFLDEITEMPLEVQVKLLRLLESGSCMRSKSTSPCETDVRVIAWIAGASRAGQCAPSPFSNICEVSPTRRSASV